MWVRLEYQRPRRDEQVDPLADDQLAHERNRRVALGIELLDGASGAEQIASERSRVGRCSPSPSRSRERLRCAGVKPRGELVYASRGRAQARAAQSA